MSPPLVSVVIVTWNGRALLERFLPSVLATDHPRLEVVVADNASTDGTAAWLREAHPEAVVVEHATNGMFAKGNNDAVPSCAGDLLVFLNNDVEVPPGWLRPLVAAFDDPAVAAAQPKLLQHGDRGRFEYAGASGGFIDALGYPFTRGRLFDTLEADRGQYDDARDVFWASGAALAIRKEAFVAAGGFDERFEMHMEEIDLCWRLWRRGQRVRVVPASEVYHLGGASLPQGNPRKAYYNFRNSLAMLAKNLPEADLRRVLRARRVLDGVAAARARLGGHRDEAEAIAEAWTDFRTRLPDLPRPAGTEAVVPLPYRGRIVADYFLRGRRHFSDLPASRFTLPART
ncbi:MAG: glycosyltransferase family 2 protein [Bacteroidota bacterium]